ncbi:GNAT family N-acetyltransferase [Jeotgalibacillus aurantiacus]|uniref:GNAT family N-acetyltransferase n=1 Tax=Jeotgalibacillus aurantiacus TaxID=2763266 RepID=UPI001D0B4D07|nr:GNAT family N-acetyltransferase [Jeotgalibacillus aurantiacus]
MEWSKSMYRVSDDVALLDIHRVHELLSSTYWAKDRSLEMIEKTVAHSMAFGVYKNEKLIGFARVITDQAVFSWVMDVVIDADYRGDGLGQWLMECILAHPSIKHTAFALATSDAQGFYNKFNFKNNECMTRPLG